MLGTDRFISAPFQPDHQDRKAAQFFQPSESISKVEHQSFPWSGGTIGVFLVRDLRDLCFLITNRGIFGWWFFHGMMPFVEGVGVGPKGFTRGLKKYCNVWNLCHAPEKHKHVSKCSKTLVRKIEVVVPCLSSRDWRLLQEYPSTSQWSIPWLWRQVTTERTRPAPRLTQAKQ